MTQEESELASLVARIVELHGNQKKISPLWIATEAMMELDPSRRSVALVYQGCHLQLRQMAREQLRKRFDHDDDDNGQHNLFPDLQKRYPMARSTKGEDPNYVLLEYMTWEDIQWNVARLRSEATAKNQHADALLRWWRRRKRRQGM